MYDTVLGMAYGAQSAADLHDGVGHQAVVSGVGEYDDHGHRYLDGSEMSS